MFGVSNIVGNLSSRHARSSGWVIETQLQLTKNDAGRHETPDPVLSSRLRIPVGRCCASPARDIRIFVVEPIIETACWRPDRLPPGISGSRDRPGGKEERRPASAKTCSKPPGVQCSSGRAGASPAFHNEWRRPRGIRNTAPSSSRTSSSSTVAPINPRRTTVIWPPPSGSRPSPRGRAPAPTRRARAPRLRPGPGLPARPAAPGHRPRPPPRPGRGLTRREVGAQRLRP